MQHVLSNFRQALPAAAAPAVRGVKGVYRGCIKGCIGVV